LSYLKRYALFLKDTSIVALTTLIVAVVFSFIPALSWATAPATILAFLVSSTITFRGHEKREAIELLRRLNRLVQEFYSLNVEAVAQSRDIRMTTIIEFVSYQGSKLPSDHVHLYKDGVRAANDAFRGWFNEYSERLKFFMDRSKFLEMKTMESLTNGFRRLLFEHYEKIIDASIDFMNKAGFADREEATIKFEEFKTNYNSFIDRFKTYCEDLKEYGLKMDGWEPRTIAKDIDVKTLGKNRQPL